MSKWRLNFYREVWGFYECEADTKEEATKKIMDNDCDMFDNKSEETLQEDKNGEWEVYKDE